MSQELEGGAPSLETANVEARETQLSNRDLEVFIALARLGYPVAYPDFTQEQFKTLLETRINDDFDINTRDELGRTLLHYVADMGDAELYSYLLNKNCDPNIQDMDGRFPCQFVKPLEFNDSLKVVLELGLNEGNHEALSAVKLEQAIGKLFSKQLYLDALQVFCDYTEDPNHKFRYDKNILHLILDNYPSNCSQESQQTWLSCALALLILGVDGYACDNSGVSFLARSSKRFPEITFEQNDQDEWSASIYS